MRLVVAVATRDEFFADVREQAISARDGAPLANTRSVTVRDGVATIPVCGPLFRHAGLFTKLSGATSYEAIRKDLQQCLDDPSVQSILLHIDSPGGEAKGVADLAAAIYAARDVKPIKCYVEQGCSAAYWLAAATSEIVASPTAALGSIGVIATVEKADPAGKSVDIISSQSPYKRLDVSDETGRARIQRQIDNLADVFVMAVAKYRGVTNETVLDSF